MVLFKIKNSLLNKQIRINFELKMNYSSSSSSSSIPFSRVSDESAHVKSHKTHSNVSELLRIYIGLGDLYTEL